MGVCKVKGVRGRKWELIGGVSEIFNIDDVEFIINDLCIN